MCGFVALYRRDGGPVEPELVSHMRDALWHRGPDDHGLLASNGIGLGHRRLSIVDLSPAGRQPMFNEDETLALVFNGEIYNYVELAQELRSRGHQFRSNTDSEVILHLFEEEGEKCLRHLNGMFAFVIWDCRTGTLFAARDRLGIKPLYYFESPEWLLCASEIKALLLHPAVEAVPDRKGIADFLFTGHALGSKTLFSGIKRLPPGHHLTLTKNGRLEVREYWSVHYQYDWQRPLRQVVTDLGDLLDDAVRIHCRSDAPLGCHLSGGLDSSLVTALAARHRTGLESFSIRFSDGRFFDEGPHARAVARHVGTTHREDFPRPDEVAAMYAKLMWHQDEPMPDEAGFTYWTASRLAARHVKVALTGHGGDEVFAGYPAQFQAAFGSTAMFDLSARPGTPDQGLVSRLRVVFRREGWRGLLRRLASRLASAPTHDLGELWVGLHCGADPMTNLALDPGFRASLAGYTPRVEYLAPLEGAPTDQLLDRVLYHDLSVYLPHLLHKEDRASMALSLESRVPLLDYRVIEFLATVPPEQKVPGLVPKALIRAVAGPLLPKSVVERRDKTPFPSPGQQWLKAGWLPLVGQLLREERTLDRGVFLADELRCENPSPALQATAFNVELWFRIFIDRDPVWLEKVGGTGVRGERSHVQ